MKRLISILGATCLLALAGGGPAAAQRASALQIYPTEISLDGQGASQHFVVTAMQRDGSSQDVTERARLQIGNPSVAKIDGSVVRAVADGRTKLSATLGGQSAVTWVTNSAMDLPAEVSFVNDVMPVLTKAGCNGSACHGAPPGKGGFKLSLFGYSPSEDREAIVAQDEGSRVDLAAPAQSLILRKPTATEAHGGGMRFAVDSPEHRTLLAWLQDGARGPADFEPVIENLEVYPAEVWLPSPEASHRLVATAVFSDGSRRDVTEKSVYVSNEESVATADAAGLVTGATQGETAVMLRLLGRVAVSRVAVLPGGKAPAYPGYAQHSFIDEIIDAKLKKLHVIPSDPASDAEFVRRVYLDTLGLTPSVEEAVEFLHDPAPDKRARLIDTLLARPEFADLWTLKWSDILRNNPQLMRQGLVPYHLWIREQIASNAPYDQFARALITATGKTAPESAEDTTYNAAANFYLLSRNPLDTASFTSQVFLGVRIECARCHNHPFEKWTMSNYYDFAAFFGNLRTVGNNQMPRSVTVIPPRPMVARLRRPQRPGSRVRNPVTGQPAQPTPLDGEPVADASQADPREALVDWMVSPANPFFAANLVNRVWAHYLGRGIIDPVDDVRVTNPASNPALLEALAGEFVRSGFDVRHMHRLILNSRTYQTSSSANPRNERDTTSFARYYPKRMTAEQLFDSISQATTIWLTPANPRAPQRPIFQNRFGGPDLPGPIERVTQLPTPQAPGAIGQFLTAFGKPRRETVCECERSAEGNMSQALALLNSAVINQKIQSPAGRTAQIAAAGWELTDQLNTLYLATLSRYPSREETADAASLVRSGESLRAGLEDLMWGLINSREFVFVH